MFFLLGFISLFYRSSLLLFSSISFLMIEFHFVLFLLKVISFCIFLLCSCFLFLISSIIFILSHAVEVGSTPLHIACKEGIVPIIKLLLDMGAKRNIRDRQKRRPVDICWSNETKDILEHYKIEK